MEHRDQRQESHGVHVCNKCGWPFPNPHPSAKHRRAHKRVCGTIEGFKLVESEANTLLTIVSDDDVDHKISSPKFLEGSFGDKGADGMKPKSKESEDEVFSDAVAEFSEGVGPNKSIGDALDSVSTAKMVVEDEMSSSQTLKDEEVLVIAGTTISQSGCEMENKINQEFVNLETDSGTQLSSSSTENKKNESLVVAETGIKQLGKELETKINQECVDLETSSSSTKNQKVENSFVAETEEETNINRYGNSVIPSIDHMNATTTGDLYPNEPETILPALQQGSNVDSLENVPLCSFPSPDRKCDDEDFNLCNNLTEIPASSGKMDNDKSEPLPKIEEKIKIPTELFAHSETLQSVAENDMSIYSEMPQSVVVSDSTPIDLTHVTSDARKELESYSSNLLETDKIKEENDNVHLPSVSSDLNIVDHPEALVEDSKDHKEVKLTNCVVQDHHEGVSRLEDNFKDPIPKESYFTLQSAPFDLTSEVASFDTKTVENRQKQEGGVKNVSGDVEPDCSSISQEAEEIPIQEVNAAQIKGVLSENEKHVKSQTLSGAGIGIDSIPSTSFSSEVESVAPPNNSLDNLSENATEVLLSEVGREVLLDDENKVCGRDLEHTVQIHLPVDTRERKDNSVNEKDNFDNLNLAGVEDKKTPSEEKFSMGIDSTPKPTTNCRENKCIAVAEEIEDESPRKISPTKSKDNISLTSDTRESVKEDDSSGAVHVACISEVNSDVQPCDIGDSNSVRNSSDVHAIKEANLVSVSDEIVSGDGLRVASETWKDDSVKINVKPRLTSSLLDVSVDAISQTDSLEGNWGSVSVLSTQSDLPAVVDGEVTQRAQAGAEETDMKADAATERQHSNRSDLFEPPSFLTLVEPNGGGIQNSAASEIQTAQNREQPNPASLQAGWFPSYTHVANDSPGRKKNEAIIAKVTNWSAGKPHTALKSLLDDAALENKQKLATHKDNLASMIQKDEKPTKNGSIEKKVDSVMQQSKSPTSQLVNREIANEWNSPARYPSDIRRERRKGRPYWAQFVCCSSVH